MRTTPRAWLINKTRITKGAAFVVTAWVRRAAAHPLVAQVLAAGELSESYARTICGWTDKLPEDCRPDADAILPHGGGGRDGPAGPGRAGRGDLRPVPARYPGQDKDEAFEDRSVRLETTFEGAGVLGGDLTPECAAVVGAVLDALSAPAGAEDTRSQASGTTMASKKPCVGSSPQACSGAGRAVRQGLGALSLADLLMMDGSSALQQEWISGVRTAWAAHRAAASAGGSDGGAWLDGMPPRGGVRRGGDPGRDRRGEPPSWRTWSGWRPARQAPLHRREPTARQRVQATGHGAATRDEPRPVPMAGRRAPPTPPGRGRPSSRT